MKFLKKKDGELMKVFASVALTVLFCVLAILFLEYQIYRFKIDIMNGFARENEYILKMVSEEIRDEALSEDEVVEIVKSAPATGTRYWMLFSEDGPLFERNTDTTSMISGMSFVELENYYMRQGGSGVVPFIELIRNGEFFSAVVIKDVLIGNEIISADYVEIGGKRYCVATGISQSFLFSSAGIGERATMLRILVIACCAILVTLVAVFSSSARSKAEKLRELREELIEKNLFIQRELGKGDERLDDAQALPDPITGLYSLRFYETFMMKLTKRQVSPIGMIIVRILNYHDMAAEKGLNFSKEAVRKAATILLDQSGDADLCALLRTNELVMVKLKTTEKLTIQSAKEIFRELAESGIEAKFAGGFAYKEGVTAVDAVTEAAMNAVRPI
ncbi:MAG: hypothetical protein PHP22_03265 [Oscillospiraceae bacterium]|nr:hypothetical protein [Oscillospiraceae bacterium]